jgi:acetyl-CoA carboxylase biotin carboxyl carrier protein
VTDLPEAEEPAVAGPEGQADMSAASGVAELVALIDRLEPMLGASGLDEIEIASGSTTLVLRAPAVAVPGPPAPGPSTSAPASAAAPAEPEAAASESGLRQVKAPLTGVFYLSPSPGAAAYVKLGSEVIAGQVIGLLEAMKLFNEIKSDVTGVVRTIVAENGALVKTHQVLIEVEPT